MSPPVIKRSFQQLLRHLEAGDIKPRIHGSYPLADAVEALREIQDRRVMGKLVLRMP